MHQLSFEQASVSAMDASRTIASNPSKTTKTEACGKTCGKVLSRGRNENSL
jgi:hypothetical protein